MNQAPPGATEHITSSTVASHAPVQILSVVAVLLILFIIFAPQEPSDVGTMYSSYAAGAGGTRALYEVLGKVGFTVERNEKPLNSEPDTTSTYVLINPAQPLTVLEQAALLNAVRHGAILVFTIDDDALADSLGFEAVSPTGGFYTMSRMVVAGENPPEQTNQDPRAVFQTAFPITAVVASRQRNDNQTFLWLRPEKNSKGARLDSAQQSALVIGHRVGSGYAIGIAPASIVMNQSVREPRVAIAIVRGIQFASVTLGAQSRSDKVVFDEYHHGFGTHADMVAAVEHALIGTTLGRMTVELIVAALVLLLAYAVRPLAPVAVSPVSRRSPLEHVGALAYAYSQVNAHALGSNRLVRGLRRRHSLGIPRSLPDSEYLSMLRARIPAVSADVDRVLASLATKSSDSSDSFAATGTAIANIERVFRE